MGIGHAKKEQYKEWLEQWAWNDQGGHIVSTNNKLQWKM